MWSCGVAARREAGPVVEVDDTYITFGRDDAVAAIYLHIKHIGCVLADFAHLVLVELKPLALAVDGFMSILAVSFVKRIEPLEETRT